MLPFELTKDTPYLALSGELWSVFYEYLNRNWSCHKGFLLYLDMKLSFYTNPSFYFVMQGDDMALMSDVSHVDVITWKRFPCYWPFVRGITGGFPSQSPSNAGFDVFFDVSSDKRMNSGVAGDLRRSDAQCDVTAMYYMLVFAYVSYKICENLMYW